MRARNEPRGRDIVGASAGGVEAAHHPISVRDVEWPRGTDSRTYDVQVGPPHAYDGSLVGMSITFAETTRHRKLQEASI